MTCAERPIFLGDLAPSRFTCAGGTQIEASVATNNSIDGTGSTANPLMVVPSTDANNLIVLGGDGRLFVGAMTVVGAGNACGDIGATFMIRSAVMDAATNELTLEGAAEHDTEGSSQSASISGALVPLNNLQTDTGSPVNVVINNPSSCRDLLGISVIFATFDCDLEASGQWNYGIKKGGVFPTNPQVFRAPVSAPFWSGTLTAVRYQINVIVAGGTLMETWEPEITGIMADTSGNSGIRRREVAVTTIFSTRA